MREVTCPLCGATDPSPEWSLDWEIFPCKTRKYRSRNKLMQSRLCFRTQNGIATPPMKFEMKHLDFHEDVQIFTELDAPTWLTGETTTPGSTMDDRWFWQEHVLTLKVGESIDTDFRKITRLM